jgi:3-hydroxyisobutyrate dehydrogenase
MNQKPRIGFIGLGLMGNPMAKNILNAGYPLTVYNRTKSKTAELESEGASVADSPLDLAKNSDIIITMVTDGEALKEVLFAENGVIKSSSNGQIVIDMSTIGPTVVKEVHAKLKEVGVGFLDAPVTGSTPAAISGSLTIFIGGDKDIFQKSKELLEAMGKNLHYMGESGSGQAIKLINNHLIGMTIQALSEGMQLADAMNLPREKVADALNGAMITSPFINLKMPNLVKNNFPLLFTVANMKKDLQLALDEAKQGNKKTPELELVVKQYEKAIEQGLSEEDMSTIIKVIENKSA